VPSVLISGANRGLGFEFARQYAGDGWTVHATARNLGAVDDLAALGANVRIHQLDVTEHADSDESGHRFRLKADSVPIDCGQHSDDPGQGASVDGRQGVTEGDVRQALTVLAAALRMLSPFKVSLCALWTSRSRMASATVGFAIASCQ
jgi:NAD(P)-dependent dehydrogenase (short-subunit alcohol dehydrogenase family)